MYNNLPISSYNLRFSCFKPKVGFLASHGGDVTFIIHNRINPLLESKETKNNIFNKEEKKTNQSSRLFPPSMFNSLEKRSKIFKP